MVLLALSVVVFLIVLSFWKRFAREVLVVSILTLSLTTVGFWVTGTEFFRVYVYPESFTLADWEVTDYAVAHLRPAPEREERIVVVNIGELSRREMARLIRLISRENPRVIAFNGFFRCPDDQRDSLHCPQLLDTLGNRMLRDAIREAGNVVLGSTFRFHGNDTVFERSDTDFSRHAKEGFVTMPLSAQEIEQDRDVVLLSRSFYPWVDHKGERLLSLPVQAAMQYNPALTNRFLSWAPGKMIINYRGNVDESGLLDSVLGEDSAMFILINHTAIEEGLLPAGLLNGKIVLMGYMDRDLENQKYFTPLNRKVAGRANPDMFGTVIWANILAMILNDDYIRELSTTEEFAIALLACLAHVALLLVIFGRWPVWYDLSAVALIITQLAIYSLLRFNLFVHLNLKMNLVITVTSLAIAGISVTVYKELWPQVRQKLNRRRSRGGKISDF